MDATVSIVGVVLVLLSIAVSIYVGRDSLRQLRKRGSESDFLRVRNIIKSRPGELRKAAAKEHSTVLVADIEAPVIAKPGWLLPFPVDVSDVRLTLTVDGGVHPISPDYRSKLRRYWPVDSAGRRLEFYHQAVEEYDRPANWFNGTCYRMLRVEVDPAKNGLKLYCGLTRYWEGFDTTEALAHEAAYVYSRTGGKKITGPFRNKLGDPFDFERRYCTIGFVTLTVRQAKNGSTFYLHRRDERVATGRNMTNLIPAGEFQPSDDSKFAAARDLNLWHAIIREYAEEMMGIEEVRNRRGAPIDYDKDEPFRALQLAKHRGSIRPYALGIGIEPLTWKAQLYTACIFNAVTFDRIFKEMPSDNNEGILELPTLNRRNGHPFQGWPFDEEVITQYLHDPNFGPSGRVTLTLALKHRSNLGI